MGKGKEANRKCALKAFPKMLEPCQGQLWNTVNNTHLNYSRREADWLAEAYMWSHELPSASSLSWVQEESPEAQVGRLPQKTDFREQRVQQRNMG